MPNRMLREGILTSERVNRLGPQAEILYRRLMSVVDDFGRYHGHPGLIRAGCYPLKLDQVREADITRWLAEVQSAGLILLYSTSGKQFVQLLDTRWQVRAHGSKFPEPPPESANICAQMLTDAPVVVDENVDVDVVEKGGNPPKSPRARGKAVVESEILVPAELETPEARQALREWLEHKRTLGKPYKSPAAVSKLLQEHARAGPVAFIEAVNHSIARNYQGIYAPSGATNGQRTGTNSRGNGGGSGKAQSLAFESGGYRDHANDDDFAAFGRRMEAAQGSATGSDGENQLGGDS